MTDSEKESLRVGDPVRLKESDIDVRGDVWQLRTGRYVVVRWQNEYRTTHAESALEYDASRSRAEWSRHMAHEDRSRKAGDRQTG
jgi:hypothetical protein